MRKRKRSFVHRDGEWSAPVKSVHAAPSYRWLEDERRERLELEVASDAKDIEIDVSEGLLHITWLSTRCRLTLPVGFCVDLGSCSMKLHEDRFVFCIPKEGKLKITKRLATGLSSTEGFGIIDGFLATNDADSLRRYLLCLWEDNLYSPGEVEGRDGPDVTAIRSDVCLFLEDKDDVAKAFGTRLDELALQVQENVPALQGGTLVPGQLMATVYQTGARYTPHFDCVNGDSGRVLTCILYLNPFWTSSHGGQLRIWPFAKDDRDLSGPFYEVSPIHGRLVVFLCDSRNLHEVCPVTEDSNSEPRLAISCWYYFIEDAPNCEQIS